MFKRDRLVEIFIGKLFKWQLNVTPNGHTIVFKCSAICGFHNAGPTTGHSCETNLCNSLSEFSRLLIINIVLLESCRTKNGNAWPYEMQSTKGFDEFLQNPDCK